MSMTKDQLLRYIDNPSALNGRTLGELKEILDEYPYFQSAHLLYIRNLQKENNFRFSSQLKTSALYVTDRSVLYRLLNPAATRQPNYVDLEITSDSQHQEKQISPESPEEISSGTFETEKTGFHSALNNPDFLNFDYFPKPYQLEESENSTSKPLGEIAKDIGYLSINQNRKKETDKKKGEPGHLPELDKISDQGYSEDDDYIELFDIQQHNNSDTDEFITETLARIYMKQGLHQKSINAFKRLSLKYPEKSAYFARQIEEIKNLINK